MPSRRAAKTVGTVLALAFAGLGLALLGAGTGVPAAPAAVERAASSGGPALRVLGTAQDGGLPHAGCDCVRCEAARRDPARRRLVASLALLLPSPGEAGSDVYLVDATPDVREQLDRLRDLRRAPPGRVDRRPLAGVLLTHAHVGHYLGLAFFGFEAIHTAGLPVYATPRMAAYLRANGPWSQLVTKGEIELRESPPGSPFVLGEGEARVTVTPIQVPHRDELSDTVAFVFRGPRSRVLYVPDTDRWETWEPPLESVLAGVDVALLDGSFFSTDELPGRRVEEVPHPLMGTTMDRLVPWVKAGTLRVFFTHLNHSNPALDPASAAAQEIAARRFAILADGQELPL